MELLGTPTAQLPGVLATGPASIRFAFFSLSARDPDGRDAEYLEWHSMDHRPEQYRLPELRCTLRLVSTPECRKARAASVERFDAVDHVMNYQFTGAQSMPGFNDLGAALDVAGRMQHRLPSVGYLTGDRAGKIAAPRAVAGEDVIPWRPAKGVWLMFERGHASPASLIDLPGVAGVWWYKGSEEGYGGNSAGLQITCCYLDEDPVECAGPLGEAMQARWASGEVEGLLAAPFYVVVPFDWGRHVPGG